MTSETSTGSELELRFTPIYQVLVDRLPEDEDGWIATPEGQNLRQEAAAEIYAIARRTTDALRGYIETLERASARDQEKFKRMKEAKDELADKVVELDRRLRDPNRLRPDPLGPSVPRGGKPELVEKKDPSWMSNEPPSKPDWCPGRMHKPYMVDAEDMGCCDHCGRWLAIQAEHLPWHKWGGRYIRTRE